MINVAFGRRSSTRRAASVLASTVLGALTVTSPLVSRAEAESARGPLMVDVDGTQFRVTLRDGRILQSVDLVGAVLGLPSGARVRIEAVEERDGVWLHTFSAQRTDGTWANICRLGPDGRRAGFPIAGHATEDGTLAEAAPGVFEITCTAGAQGKCVRFGYRPWETSPDGRSMRPLYNACIRMVRADYGGQGDGTTRDGVLIDIYDDLKIQTAELIDGQDFEAAWTSEGAVCVRHVRVRERVSLEELERRYPRLQGRTGAACTEEFARARGALLFNRSHP